MHIDFAGPFLGHTYTRVEDFGGVQNVQHHLASHHHKTNWLLAAHGFLEPIVTDNGMAFMTEEFKTFM